MANQQDRRRRSYWRILGYILVLSLVAVGMVTWFFIPTRGRTELAVRLSNLGLGEPEIGNVYATTGGLVATDVIFPAMEQEKGSLEIRIGKLKINHSWAEIVRGANELDSIDLEEVTIRLPLERWTGLDNGLSLDLSSMRLPARTIKLQNASVILTSPNREDFLIGGIDARLTSGHHAIIIEGRIENFSGNELIISGQTSPESLEAPPAARLSITSGTFKIDDGIWQAWPFLPEGIDNWVRADGEAIMELNVEFDEWKVITLTGTATVNQLIANLPAFELPIEIASGQIELVGEQLKFKDLVASTDDHDHITAEGSLQFGNFPLLVEFSGDVQDLSTATLRKLVTDLPDTVHGRANGSLFGTVEIESDSNTTIRLESQAISYRLAYGQLISDQAEIDTRINTLKFNSQQDFVSIQGEVRISAQLPSQSIHRLIETFEMEALDERLELKGDSVGDVSLSIPLATIGQIPTWALAFNVQLPTAMISGQRLSNLTVQGHLESDVLVFEYLRGTPEPAVSKAFSEATPTDQPSFIASTIRWPIFTNESAHNQASLSLEGQSVPIVWLASVLQRQLALTEFETVEVLQLSNESLKVRIDLTGELRLNASQPDDLEKWGLTANIQNANIDSDQHSSKKASAGISYADGVFTISDLTGVLESQGRSSTLIESNNAARYLGNEIHLEKLTASIFSENERPGQVEFSGNWNTTNKTGAGEVDWQKIPIELILDLTTTSNNELDLQITGSISGSLAFEWGDTLEREILKAEQEQKSTSEAATRWPLEIEGDIWLSDIGVDAYSLNALAFQVRTREGQVHVENFSGSALIESTNWKAQASLNSQLPFHLTANFSNHRISQWIHDPILTALIGNRTDFSGLVNGRVQFSGQLFPLQWQTQGTLAGTSLRVNDQRISDIRATWTYFGDDQKSSAVSIEGLGGTIELAELTNQPQLVRVEWSNIDAEQVTAVLPSAVNRARLHN